VRTVRFDPDAWEDFLFSLADDDDVKILKARYHY